MKLRKSSEIEISKIMLGVIVTGVVSLLCVCIPVTYKASEEIEIKLLDKVASLEKESKQCQRIGNNLEKISGVLGQSSERVKVLLDSSDIFKNQTFSDIETRSYLLMSSKKRLQVKESISLVDSQVGDSGLYINSHQINEVLKKMLNKEYDIWFSFEKFLLQNDSIDWKENEIHFKSFDDNLLSWYELGNSYNNLYKKTLLKHEDISLQRSYSEKKFDTNLSNLYFIRASGRLGIVIALLILIPLLKLTFKKTIKM